MSVQQTAPGIHAAVLSNIGLAGEVYVRWTGVDLHISVLQHPCAVALLSSQIIEPQVTLQLSCLLYVSLQAMFYFTSLQAIVPIRGGFNLATF